MKSSLLTLMMGVLLLGFANGNTFADQRNYVWTYEYKTVEKGKGEIEHYMTFASSDAEDTKGKTSVEHQVELEVGMTDRFDFSVYQKFTQEPDEGMKYGGYKFRTRYKFGEKGKYFFDPLLYAEYKGKPDFSEHEFELKLILAKNIGKLNLALNPVLEIEKENGEFEFKPEYAFGTSYRVNDTLSTGIEFKGSEKGHYVGPVVSHGSEHIWGAIGSALKISEIKDGKSELMIRMIMGIGF